MAGLAGGAHLLQNKVMGNNTGLVWPGQWLEIWVSLYHLFYSPCNAL